MNKLILTLVLLTANTWVAAQIYKWTDNNGVIHFSDKPHEGAEIVNMPESQIYSSPSTSTTESSKEELLVEKKSIYKKIAILEPADQTTIRNNQGNFIITVAIEPDLAAGDMLQLIMDRQPFGAPQASLSFALKNINRGSHTFAVQIINAKKEVLVSSKIITIYNQRPRVGMGIKARVFN